MDKQLIIYKPYITTLQHMIRHPIMVIYEQKPFGGGVSGMWQLRRLIHVYNDGTSKVVQTNEFTFQ